jgi:hypothetical protein
MFRSIFTTIFRGLMSSDLCRYLVEFRGCTFVMFLRIMRPYVIVSCVRVPGVPVLVKSGHTVYDQMAAYCTRT